MHLQSICEFMTLVNSVEIQYKNSNTKRKLNIKSSKFGLLKK